MLFIVAVATAAAAAAASLPKSYHIGCFDWDDNLLVMPATLKMQFRETVESPWRSLNISSHVYAAIRDTPEFNTLWRGNPKIDMFYDFSDMGGDDAFAKQTALALRGYDDVRRTAGAAMPLLRYHLFAGFPITVITARLHAPANLQAGLEVVLRQNFTDADRAAVLRAWLDIAERIFNYSAAPNAYGQYFSDPENVLRLLLRASSYYPVSWPIWNKRYKTCKSDDCKATAIKMIVDERVREIDRDLFPGVPVISFSDDDAGNQLKVIEVLRDNVVPRYPDFCFRVYNTTVIDAPPVVVQLTAKCNDVDDDPVPPHVRRAWWSHAEQRMVDDVQYAALLP